MALLPLFPLGTVLLPGARLPLQLFEPRYLELARQLAEQAEDERRFGVVLIRKGHEVGPEAAGDLHGIGCEARVDAMALAESPIGTVVHLVATGVRRFRLDDVDTGAGTPFTTGVVTWLEEATASGDAAVAALAATALREHADYLERLGAVADPVEAPLGQVAYRVVERMVLDPADRQRVLDGADAATRLRTALSLLRREAAIVGRFGALPSSPPPSGASLN
ncbi:LON peptidase substrate-binding domain-containing protein [Oryzobacter telluris]|uniref:LON peptidase substrate-binding domain-containing protein n=1 Tax=Oryzobacter telluris TaxID=3149179 RepID=UPI00370CFF50